MLKKMISLLIVSAMSIGLLASCGEKKASEDGIVTIDWYMRKPVSDMSQQEKVEAVVNGIIGEKIGVNIKFHFVETAAWSNRLNVMTTAGEAYDIISLQGSEFTNLVQKDAFVDLSDMLSKYGKAIEKKVPKYAWDAVTFNNNVYGIPAQSFNVPYSAFAFQKNLVEKYDFDYKNVQSLKELEPFLEKIKENEKGIVGIVATAAGGLQLPKSEKYSTTDLDFIYYDNETKEFEVKYFTDETLNDYKTLWEFRKKGYIASDAINKTETTAEIKTKRYAVIPGRRNAAKSSNLYGFECVEAEPTYGVISTSNVLNALNAISVKSKHPEKAVELLNLIWEDTYLSNILAYGIEGEDFTVTKGDIHNYNDVNEISVEPKSGNEVKWSIWHNWLGPLWDQWDSSWNSRESLEEMEKVNQTAKISPILGFVIDFEPIKNEVAQMKTISSDADQVLRTGSMTDYDTFIEDLKKKFEDAGIKKVLDEINSQYKEWQKQKK